jgi:hypothetical protein
VTVIRMLREPPQLLLCLSRIRRHTPGRREAARQGGRTDVTSSTIGAGGPVLSRDPSWAALNVASPLRSPPPPLLFQ